METTLEVPAAPTAAAASEAAPASAQRSGQDSDSGRPAGMPENLTGAALRAELARNRRARRGSGSVAQDGTAGQPAKPTTPEPPAAATPAADEGTGPDQTYAASDATEAETVQQLAQATPEPKAEPEEPDPEAVLEDPEAIEALTEEQIRAIKNASTRKLLRRVQKLTARVKRAEALLANQPGGQEAEKASPTQATTEPGDAVTQHPEVRKLDTQRARIERMMQWAEANPDGGVYQAEDGWSGNFDAAQVEAILRNGQRALIRVDTLRTLRVDEIQREHQRAETQALERAKQAFPWMADSASDEYAIASGILSQVPHIRQHPEWALWLGDAIEGRKAREARAAGTKPTPRAVPPKVPPPGGAAAAQRVDPTQNVARELAAAEAAYEQSGRSSDLKRVMSLQRQLARQNARR